MRITRRQLRRLIKEELDKAAGPSFTDEYGHEWTLNFKEKRAVRCPESRACRDKDFDEFSPSDQAKIEELKPGIFKR